MSESSYGITIGIIILALDRILKILSTRYLFARDILLFNGLVRLTHVRNPGAAFGFLPSQRGLIIFVSILALIFVIRLFRKVSYKNFYFSIGFWILIAGILGNLLDRILLGYVIDYVQILNSPIFNVSDIAILIGMATILFFS
ncbi:MAG: signal peptidase II [bacterium]|nr:signal peptidase II [bacterium]